MRLTYPLPAGISEMGLEAQLYPPAAPSSLTRIDVSVGDLLGVRSLKETYFGFGASHRSGIFGSSQLLGNINGGSNYIYTYIESRI